MSLADFFDHSTHPADDAAEHRTVTVKKGDSLWAIASEITGDGNRWQELADANPDKAWSKDYMVQPGEVLNVPKSWGEPAPEGGDPQAA